MRTNRLLLLGSLIVFLLLSGRSRAGEADLDGDGLDQATEIRLGTDPLHKDLFVEMDWMVSPRYSLKPSPAVLTRLEAIFAAAPVVNPDGQPGIRLHLELSEEVPWVEDLNVEPDSPDFFEIQRDHFDPARMPVFHYMIWADHILRGGGTGATGFSFGIPHSAFVVALGGLKGGSEDQQVGTFLHELGHNLGLRHGSTTDSPRKPNHLSVMSYNFQMIGLLRDSPGERFDFQPFALPELNEDLLDEVRGLGDQPLLQGYQTVFFHQKRAYRAGAQGPVDFNRNGVATDQGFHQDLNRDFRREILVATPNEWSVLEYRGGAIGQSGDLELLGRKLRSRQETCEEPSLKELLLEAPER